MYDPATNEQVALSHKCADMKRVVPELMGVSRAILENVIFCHQEEAKLSSFHLESHSMDTLSLSLSAQLAAVRGQKVKGEI